MGWVVDPEKLASDQQIIDRCRLLEEDANVLLERGQSVVQPKEIRALRDSLADLLQGLIQCQTIGTNRQFQLSNAGDAEAAIRMIHAVTPLGFVRPRLAHLIDALDLIEGQEVQFWNRPEYLSLVLRVLRERTDLRQKDLAKSLHLSQGRVSQAESGHPPMGESLFFWANRLGRKILWRWVDLHDATLERRQRLHNRIERVADDETLGLLETILDGVEAKKLLP